MQETVRKRLSQGVSALPFAVSRAQQETMLAYLQILNRWNGVHNLTAVRDSVQQVSVHLLDSLAVLPWIDADTERLADVGSGAGLPALVLAIMRPPMRVFAVEVSRKKSAFIRHAAIHLGLRNVEVVNERVERWLPDEKMDVVISRAMSSFPLFLSLTAHLGDAETLWLGLKGPMPENDPVQGFILQQPQEIDVPLLAAKRYVYSAKKKENT